MTEPTPEQLTALTAEQKTIYDQLDEASKKYYLENFSASALGPALERRQTIQQSRQRQQTFEKKVNENLAQVSSAQAANNALTGQDVALATAGAAGLIGLGVLSRKIAPEGKAIWRGVRPADLLPPLYDTFAGKERTDLRQAAPVSDGSLQVFTLARTGSGLLPALTIVLSPLPQATRVQISNLSSESLVQTLKEGGMRLFHLLADGLNLGRSLRNPASLAYTLGNMVDHGAGLYQSVQELDLEDRAWEAIQKVAEPLQAAFDEKQAIENARLGRLEAIWDTYYNCTRCSVAFGAEDTECRVCGTERPVKPYEADPRRK